MNASLRDPSQLDSAKWEKGASVARRGRGTGKGGGETGPVWPNDEEVGV
jgi:hypothetical protein